MTANIHAVSEPDEDIIELTDVIEQGVPAAPAASAASMDDHLSDLMYADADKDPEKESEDDLDALLAEIGAAPQEMPKTAGDALARHSINPNETLDMLDMPDMREVEELLDELNIPPQPSVSADIAVTEPDAESPGGIPDQHDAPPPDVDAGDELDAMLDGAATLQAADAPPATLSAKAPDPSDELDALLDGIASAPAAPVQQQPGMDAGDELDALLDGIAPAPAAPAQQTPPPDVDAGDELDAMPDGIASPCLEATEPAAPAAEFSATDHAAPPLPAAAAMSPQIFEAAAVGHEIPNPASSADDLDAFLDSMPPISPAKPDEMPNFTTEQRAAETGGAEMLTLSSENMPAENPATTEMAPLPRQWENLLGDAAAHPPAQAPESASSIMEERMLSTLHAALEKIEQRIQVLEVRMEEQNAVHISQSFTEQMDRVEKRLAELSAPATPSSDTAELKTRIQALENNTGAAETAENISTLNATLENTKQRLDILEGSAQEIHAAQAERTEADNQTRQQREKLWRGMEERLEGIAERLDKMESGAREELERAAAAAAARILREELAAVFSEAAG